MEYAAASSTQNGSGALPAPGAAAGSSRFHLKVFAVLGCCAVLAASGCHSADFSGTIAVIPRDTAAAFSVTEHAGAAEAARRLHVSIYWNGSSSEDDVERQIELAEQAIDRHSMGIVLSPSSPFASVTVVRRALARGIPVVIVGTMVPLPPSANLSYVLEDVRRTGALAAARLKAILGSGGEVSLLGVDPMYAGSVERARAVEDSLERTAPSIRIVGAPPGAFSFGQTEQAAESAIRAHPGLKAIVALNLDALRAAKVAVQATGSAGRVRIIGCDQGFDMLFLLRKGVLDSLIIQNMRAMGGSAVSNIVARRRGETVEKIRRFEPVLVTRANIDDEDIQKLLMIDWRPKP